MKYSKLFGKTKKSSKEFDTRNATLLIKAGFVNQLMAGAYSYLPLGLRVIEKISQIVREEMNSIGGQELQMPKLHPDENWKTTGGWDSIDVLFKLKSRGEKEYALAQSAEEVIAPLIKEYVLSAKDLPVLPYQIAWKFRDELRAKSGVLRGREFLMKDMYSLHENQAEFDKFYQQAKEAYIKVYERCGLVAKVTEASGGSFSKKISYEFMVLTDAGEDDILYSENSSYCINKEITQLNEGDDAPDGSGKLKLGRASEVGNVFDLGTRYQDAFDINIAKTDGTTTRGIMGCYGIGITRLMGVIVEKFNDDKGIIWPMAVSPYHVHIVTIAKTEEDAAFKKSAEVYEQLTKAGIEVLWDERMGTTVGEKFADADLIGIPVRLVISEKSLKENKVELKERNKSEVQMVELANLTAVIADFIV